MNGKRWRKAGALAALAAMLVAPADAYLFFGPEQVTVTPAVEYCYGVDGVAMCTPLPTGG